MKGLFKSRQAIENAQQDVGLLHSGKYLAGTLPIRAHSVAADKEANDLKVEQKFTPKK